MDKIKELAEQISIELTKIKYDDNMDINVTVIINAGRVDFEMRPKKINE